MKKVLLFFVIAMMAITASARDMVFDTNDTWSKDNSTKSISCTKDGVTLTIASSGFITPDVMKNSRIEFGPMGTATITVNAGTATVTGISVAGTPESNNFDLTGAGPWTCPIEMSGLKKDNTSRPVENVKSFTVHIQDAPAPTGDVIFDTNDTWSKDNSAKSISCTKDGVTLTIASSGFITPDVMKNSRIEFGPMGTATITVNAGTATVTGISVAGEPESNNFDLTGAGPWTCPIEMSGLKKDNTSRPVENVKSFTVHIGYTLNSAGYATFSCKDNVNISGAEAYKASVDGETITLTKLTGYIPAGNGVILYSEDPSAIVTLSVAASGDAAADVSGNDLKATTKADGSLATFEANSWALGDGQEFLHFTGDSYIYNRAYLVHEKPAGAKAMRMVFAEGEATGIDATMIETATREGKFIDGSKIVIIKNGTKYNVAGQVIK